MKLAFPSFHNVCIYFITTTLCGCSMLLSALFILDVSNLSAANDKDSTSYILIVFAMVIGVSIDTCKYVFWKSSRKWHRVLSVIILCLSWFASFAFFSIQDNKILEGDRKSTPEYRAYQQQLSILEEKIENNKQLFRQRMESKYHQQWDKAEDIDQKLSKLTEEYTALTRQEPSIGLTGLERQGLYSLYSKLGDLFYLSVNSVRVSIHSILSLLIEVCSLAAVSLAVIQTRDSKNSSHTESRESVSLPQSPSLLPSEILEETNKRGLREEILKTLLEELVLKKIEPQLNQVMVRFDLESKEVKPYFKLLLDFGYLVPQSGGIGWHFVDPNRSATSY